MVPSMDTADYSNGTAQMATHLLPLHTVSLLTPASADLPRRLEAPDRLLRDNAVAVANVLSVLLNAAPSDTRPERNKPLW